jgi:hypothetical protein
LALNDNNESDSPYRRLIKLASAEAATNGSGIEAAARAIGVSVQDVEPWDYRYAIGEANRGIAPSFPDTEITSRYLHIVPHPDVSWWAMRVQLVSDPGYMVNYGLGAVLTAEIRQRTSEAIGPFDGGNQKWYGWSSDQLLVFGSERSAKDLMQALLGRPPSINAMLEQIRRIGAAPAVD